jgi:hypothetical protein
MRPFLLGLFTIIALYCCKLNKKIKPEFLHDFEFIETQMAEIKAEPEPQIEISKKDSLEFLEFWKEFYKSYKENDTNNLIRLSLDSVNSPVFIETTNRFKQEPQYISIADFLNAPIRNKFTISPMPFSKKVPLYVVYRYKYDQDTINKKIKGKSVILNYYVLVETKEIKGNYEFRNIFSLSFIRKNKSIRFSGMEINGESYPRLVNDSTTRSKLYFPLYRKTQDPIANLNAIDTSTNLWYSACLSDFEEPNLYTYSGEDNIYRFTWIRSFHNPVVIRFQKHGNEYILTTKEMISNDRYIPNEFVVNTSQHLTAAKWKKLEFKLGRINFWNKASIDSEPTATDGAQWILEAKVDGKYHFVQRMFVEMDLKECCKYLLQLSKLKIREEDIY